MKKTSIFFTVMISLSLLVMISLSQQTFAQNTEKQEKENARIEAIKKLVESRRFAFIPQSASPQSGRTLQLSYGYQMTVTKDTIQCDLPYYGRAYTATPGDSGGGGINFRSTSFDYTSKDGSKGGWDITIVPKSAKNVSRMIFNISNSGSTTLQVTSNQRQSIRFSGHIQELK